MRKKIKLATGTMSFQELVGFLGSPSAEINRVALENILPITPASAGQSYLFKENDFQGVRALKKLALQTEDAWSAQNASIALVNLTDDAAIRSEVASDANAVKGFAKIISASPKASYVKYVAMLLNNISREQDTLAALKGPLLFALALTTARPANVGDEDFDFVVCAMAEFGRVDAPEVARLLPQMYGQLASPSLNRRMALASVIKNCLFDVNVHGPLAVDTPLLEAIMVRLKGSESMDDDDFSKLPPVVQREAHESKQREPEPQVCLLLVAALLLLSSSQVGRDMLREKHVYYIIRELHKSSTDPEVTEACEKFANMVMRGDPAEEKITPVDDDEGVEEVV